MWMWCTSVTRRRAASAHARTSSASGPRLTGGDSAIRRPKVRLVNLRSAARSSNRPTSLAGTFRSGRPGSAVAARRSPPGARASMPHASGQLGEASTRRCGRGRPWVFGLSRNAASRLGRGSTTPAARAPARTRCCTTQDPPAAAARWKRAGMSRNVKSMSRRAKSKRAPAKTIRALLQIAEARHEPRSSSTSLCDRLRAAGEWNPNWGPVRLHDLDPAWTESFMAMGTEADNLPACSTRKVVQFLAIAVDASCTHCTPGVRRHIRKGARLRATRKIAAVLQVDQRARYPHDEPRRADPARELEPRPRRRPR